MTHVSVLIDDLALVLGELERSTKPSAEVIAAADRLREAFAPVLFGPRLSDPSAPTADPAHHGRQTEAVAAWQNLPRSGSQRLRVLEAIARAGDEGRTDAELEDRLGMLRPSPGNRRGELVAGGWVRDSGRRRPTRTGSPAVVWVLTEAGRARLTRAAAS